MPDAAKFWERQPGESAQAFDAFRIYRDLGPDGRSTAKVAQACGKNVSLINRWSSRNLWQARVAAYDAEQDRIRTAAAARAVAEEAERWERQRQRQREDEIAVRDKLFDRVNRILAWPIQETRTEDGKTIIKPAKWRLRDAAEMAEAASKIGRRATGMDTEQIAAAAGTPPELIEMVERLGPDALAAVLRLADFLDAPDPGDLPGD